VPSFQAHLKSKGHEAATIKATMEFINQAIAKVSAKINPPVKEDTIVIPFTLTSENARTPRKITLSRDTAKKFLHIIQERFSPDDFAEDEHDEFTKKLTTNSNLTKPPKKSIESFVDWVTDWRMPQILSDDRILNVSTQALKDAGWLDTRVEKATNANESSAERQERSPSLEPGSGVADGQQEDSEEQLKKNSHEEPEGLPRVGGQDSR
jgi:hypothetical protein